jgi:low affinity Fe/Cu permease
MDGHLDFPIFANIQTQIRSPKLNKRLRKPKEQSRDTCNIGHETQKEGKQSNNNNNKKQHQTSEVLT